MTGCREGCDEGRRLGCKVGCWEGWRDGWEIYPRMDKDCTHLSKCCRRVGTFGFRHDAPFSTPHSPLPPTISKLISHIFLLSHFFMGVPADYRFVCDLHHFCWRPTCFLIIFFLSSPFSWPTHPYPNMRSILSLGKDVLTVVWIWFTTYVRESLSSQR